MYYLGPTSKRNMASYGVRRMWAQNALGQHVPHVEMETVRGEHPRSTRRQGEDRSARLWSDHPQADPAHQEMDRTQARQVGFGRQSAQQVCEGFSSQDHLAHMLYPALVGEMRRSPEVS